jgi:DNA-binding transcriptional MerR regulator
MNEYTIGILSKKARLSIDTIRFYEKTGILPKSERKPSGFRLYTDDYLKKIDFVKRAKSLGFSLNETKELLNIKVDESTSCQDIEMFLSSKLLEIDSKISELFRIKNSIETLIIKCTNNDNLGSCPIIENLE